MNKQHSPKVILITGCSSGFGLLLAARFAEYGEMVVATMRNLEKQSALQGEVKQRNAKVDVQALDVNDKTSIQKVIAYIKQEYGYIDVLINNAGYGCGGAFEDLTDEEFRAQMDTNFFGVLNVTREALPLMRHRPDAKIINVSSISGFSSLPCFSAYNASKFALEGWSESLLYELKPFGIDVCCVRPGSYRTEIFNQNRKYAKRFSDPNSPYFELSQHLHAKLEEQLKDNHKDVEEVPDLVEKLIYKKNPPFRSIPDLESKILYFFRRILPFKWYSAIIAHAVLPKKR